MAQGFMKVRAADGAERRVMFDGVWYELPAGETRIFAEHIAQHFAKHHNLPNADGVYQEAVVLEKVSDENLLVRGLQVKQLQFGCPFPGCTHEAESQEALREHFVSAHARGMEVATETRRAQRAAEKN